VFTTAAVDNIDHNPSSTTSKSSFHGTGISIFQHPADENDGVERDVIDEWCDDHKTLFELKSWSVNLTVFSHSYSHFKLSVKYS
jgi:hypothetical protein